MTTKTKPQSAAKPGSAAKPESVNVHDAKTRLSKLLARVEQGEEIIIARAGRPVARLVPVEPARKRQFGCGKGLIEYMSDDFDVTPDEVLRDFGVL
jgi:prevent-host-death family protein